MSRWLDVAREKAHRPPVPLSKRSPRAELAGDCGRCSCEDGKVRSRRYCNCRGAHGVPRIIADGCRHAPVSQAPCEEAYHVHLDGRLEASGAQHQVCGTGDHLVRAYDVMRRDVLTSRIEMSGPKANHASSQGPAAALAAPRPVPGMTFWYV